MDLPGMKESTLLMGGQYTISGIKSEATTVTFICSFFRNRPVKTKSDLC